MTGVIWQARAWTQTRPSEPAGPLRVAVVVTRLEGGAGVLAVRGARAMDPGACQPVTIVTGTRDWLLEAAGASGLEVIVEPSLRAAITPGAATCCALRRLEMMFARAEL